MADILGWMLGIAWKLALIYLGYTALKHVIRNGNTTLKELLETAGMAIKYGCLKTRAKLVGKLQEDAAEEQEEVREETKGPGIKVEGTVI